MLKIFNWRYIIILCVIGVLLFGLIQYLKANPLLQVCATNGQSATYDNDTVRHGFPRVIIEEDLKKIGGVYA